MGATTAGGRGLQLGERRVDGGLRLGERRADGERGCRAPGGQRQGEEWKSDADAQVFFPPRRLGLGDALKTLIPT